MAPMIFKPAARYPADPRAVFILALSVFSAGTALAVRAAPSSFESLLPFWAVVVWNALLLTGSTATLVGMAFQSINGIVVEQVGSVMVGVTALFYSGIAFRYAGTDAVASAGIIAAWGLACLARWVQLQILINNAHSRQKKQEVLDRVYAEIEQRRLREAERRANRPGRLW